VYALPFAVLPVTGFGMIGVGIPAAALLVAGVVVVRSATFSRSRRKP
jgi:hypothetical protein